MADKKQIFEELRNFGNLLRSKVDLPDDLKDDSNLLLEVMMSATLSEVFYESILVDAHLDNLHSMLLQEPTKENVKYILLVIATTYYERLLKGGGVEVGGPSKAISRFVGPTMDVNDYDMIRYAVFLRAPFALLTEQYKKYVTDMATQKKELEDCASSVLTKVKENKELLTSTDESLSSYVEKAENLRSKLNFAILNKAFSEFIGAKEKVISYLLYCLIIMGVLLLVTPIFAFIKYQSNNQTDAHAVSVKHEVFSSAQKFIETKDKKIVATQESKVKNEPEQKTNWPEIVSRLLNYLPLAVVELFLLFYFRILLSNYNSANAQLLQLKMRESVCQFVEDYIKFKKTCNVDELEKFEALIFSNLMPSAEQIPATFEGLEHLGKILGEFKPKKD